DDPAKGAALAFTVVIMGGLFQILFGVLRIGKYIEYVPHPVVSGFMSGIGVIIILIQIGPVVGVFSSSKPLEAAIAIPEVLSNAHQASVMLGAIALAVVYGIPKFLPRVNKLLPSPLLALIIGTAVYINLMGDSGVPIIGDIPTGFPEMVTPTFMLEYLPDMIKSALILAALGAIDSLLTSLVADNITRTYHKSDRELIGQGIGNTVAGFFGGLPGAGATMRTVVNVKAGGMTPLSGALHAVVLLGIVLGAGGLASEIPKAVLAGILIKVGTDIIDWDYLKRVKKAPKAGVLMMVTVLLMTVFVDLIMAVAVGMVMASFIFMKRMTDLQLSNAVATTCATDDVPLSEEEGDIMEAANGDILLYRLEGPMSFGAAKGVARRLASFDQYKALVLDLTRVPQVDFTSARALDDMIHDAQDNGRYAFLVCARPAVRSFLEHQGVIGNLAEGHCVPKRLVALQLAAEKLKKPEE
ncbi:MAG: SulP family inorganic anion transporter, partial [Gammaproteobacteria bacterium]|nr:SulP family inorganic anion transporter [Gammaproteobacteria bacterium]